MKLPNWLLFATACFIWSTTWFAIKYQVDGVAPLVSISLRFALASALLFIGLKILKLNLKFTLREHLWFMLQGLLLFGICYWFTYTAETGLTSGLVAVLSSLIIFFNVIFGRIFLKRPINHKLLWGFFLGIIGMALLYKDEITQSNLHNGIGLLVVAILANVVASLGNIVSARNQGAMLPVSQSNAFGMGYSAIFMLIIALAKGDSLAIKFEFPFIASLIYLSVFGSIVAFYCYLTLLGQIGADKAAYINLIIPILALVVSSIFESFEWSMFAFIGLTLVLIGNYIALLQKRLPAS